MGWQGSFVIFKECIQWKTSWNRYISEKISECTVQLRQNRILTTKLWNIQKSYSLDLLKKRGRLNISFVWVLQECIARSIHSFDMFDPEATQQLVEWVKASHSTKFLWPLIIDWFEISFHLSWNLLVIDIWMPVRSRKTRKIGICLD